MRGGIVKKTLKGVLSLSFSLIIAFGSFLTAFAEKTDALKQLSVSAHSAVLYCVNNNRVLFGKNENEKMKMASTTKVMTTLLALEQANSYNREITFTNEMTAEGSSMYLKAGDKVTLKDLAAGMMMASGNDAANATAISISGSTEKFAVLMNNRAKQIGMTNTNFVTPSGLDDDNHYSTAYDMALLLSYALENEDFKKITASKNIQVEIKGNSARKVTYANHNRLLSLYEFCTGGKTGFTKSAGRCLVSVAEKDGLTFVAVTLNAPDDWNDHINMYEYGFKEYTAVTCDDTDREFEIPLVGAEIETLKARAKNKATYVLKSSEKQQAEKSVYIPPFAYAPVKKGATVGKIVYTINGEKTAVVDIISLDDYKEKVVKKSFWTLIKEFFGYEKE